MRKYRHNRYKYSFTTLSVKLVNVLWGECMGVFVCIIYFMLLLLSPVHVLFYYVYVAGPSVQAKLLPMETNKVTLTFISNTAAMHQAQINTHKSDI